MLHGCGRPGESGGVLLMDDFLFIEPAREHRRDFARWCLAQDPPIQTASSTGSNVPVGLYPSVPQELLEGAFVDGFPWGIPAPQPPAVKPRTRPAAPSPTGSATKPLTAEQPRKRAARKPRKRAARKPGAADSE